MIRKLFVWLFLDPKYVWYAAIVVAFALIGSLHPNTSETCIRLVGLFLQLLGIGTVAWGISETRAYFGHKSLSSIIVAWMAKNPLLRRSAIASGANVTLGATCSSGRAYGTIGAINSSLEERVLALEKNLPIVHARISAAEKSIDDNYQKTKDLLAAEERHRKASDESLSQRLEATATGGVHITAIGAVWLFFGVILSTAPQEIHKFKVWWFNFF